MAEPSDFLRTLSARKVADADVSEFCRLMDLQQTEGERLQAIRHLLVAKDLSPNQCILVSRSRSAQDSGGIRLELQRYMRAQAFADSNRAAQDEPTWKYALRLFTGI